MSIPVQIEICFYLIYFILPFLADGRMPECKTLKGPDRYNSNVYIKTKKCREKMGVLCIKDISGKFVQHICM